MNGMTPFTAAMDLQREQFKRAGDLVEKAGVADDRVETMASVDVGQTPSEVVYEENKLELHHYLPEEAGIDVDEQYDVPILLVFAQINRPYILDLQPDRSVVRTLLEQGFDVYMIDWGEPSTLDASLSLDDNVNRYIENCVDEVRERSGLDSINVLGYCMGGTQSAMYAALYPEKVRNLVLLAAGLHFEDTGGVLELWGDEDYYSPEAVRDTFGNVPAEFFDAGFDLMDPVNNLISKYITLYDNLEDEEYVENFARMEKWLSDGIDMAGQTYVEFLQDIYQENKLYNNELYLDGEQVDLNEITMPVLQIVGEYDTLVPSESSTPFNEKIPSDDTEIMRGQSGHIGLSVSSSSHEQLWPNVCDWLGERSVVEDASDTGESGADGPADVEPVTQTLVDISGIGDVYAERLRDAGIETVADLAATDPVQLANEIGVDESRARDWVSQADELAE